MADLTQRWLIIAALVLVNFAFAYMTWVPDVVEQRPGRKLHGKNELSRLLAEVVAESARKWWLSDSRATEMRLVTLSREKHPLAVCNDGNAAGFYFKEGREEGASTWLVFLEGGGWCWDQASCNSRWEGARDLMTPPTAPARNASGILSSDPALSPFAKANKVYLKYCSSDGYIGDAGASTATHGFHFRGAQIVKGMLAELSETYGMAASDTLYLAGCSAGGRGAMFNLDYAPSMVPAGVTVIGILDAPMWVEQQPLEPSAVPFPEQTAKILQLSNGYSRLGEVCRAKHPTELWKCLYGQFRAPTLEQRFLMSASQWDSFQLGNNVGHGPPYDDGPEASAVAEFRSKVQTAMASLDPAKAASFSFGCYGHCTTEGDTFLTRKVSSPSGDVTLLSFLRDWIESGHAGKQAVETCQSFGCGCASDASAGPEVGLALVAGIAGTATLLTETNRR